MGFLRINFLKVGIICLVGCCMLACNEIKQVPDLVTPSDVIPRDSMIIILGDIHVAEALSQSISKKALGSDTARYKNLRTYYQDVFKFHKIEGERFSTSFDYYAKQPKLFDEMYEEVMKQLGDLEAVVKKVDKDTTEIKKLDNDSIK